MTVATSELAKLLGISRQRVNELGRAGKIQREPDGKWDVGKVRVALGRNMDSRQVVKAAGEKVQESAGTEREPPKGTLLYEQWRLTREKADLESFQRLKAQGELIETGKVEQAWSDVGVKFRDSVMSLPSVVCNRIPDEWRRQVASVMDDECRKVLSALSDDIRATPTTH